MLEDHSLSRALQNSQKRNQSSSHLSAVPSSRFFYLNTSNTSLMTSRYLHTFCANVGTVTRGNRRFLSSSSGRDGEEGSGGDGGRGKKGEETGAEDVVEEDAETAEHVDKDTVEHVSALSEADLGKCR